MSLFELLSTMAGLKRLDNDKKEAPKVSDEDWESAMDVIADLAQYDPTLNLE